MRAYLLFLMRKADLGKTGKQQTLCSIQSYKLILVFCLLLVYMFGNFTQDLKLTNSQYGNTGLIQLSRNQFEHQNLCSI
jgi:hypothetical protein